MVQLGQPSWSRPVLHFHCGNALDLEQGFRLELVVALVQSKHSTVNLGGAVLLIDD